MARSVMVVDDAVMMRLVIMNVIESDPHYKVTSNCENGAKALEALKKADPDVIMLDMEMPVMDGLTFIREARLRTKAKIVVLSADVQPGSAKAEQARRLGADAVIPKPSGSVLFDLHETTGAKILTTLRRLFPAS